MRAIRVHEFGEPEVLLLEEQPRPEPVEDEVLVRVQAAGVNPFETYVRSGMYAALPALPYTPGVDAGGVLVESGERVYVSGSLSGTYAEFALCRRDQVHPLPDSLSYAQGAALGVPYETAHRALLQRARPAAGESLLVHGASGAVGLALVQFALAAGLRVVGTAGSEAGRELVRSQGAVTAFDHRDPGHLAAAVEAVGGEGFDIIIELSAHVNLGDDLTALARRGRVVVVGSRGTVDGEPTRPDDGRRHGARHDDLPRLARRGGGDARGHRRRAARRVAAPGGGPRVPARGGVAGAPARRRATCPRQGRAGALSGAGRRRFDAPQARRSTRASQACRPPPSRLVAISAAAIDVTRNGGRSKMPWSSAWVTRRGPPSSVSSSLKQSTK